VYVPEPQYCFYRVGFPSNVSDDLAPLGHGSMSVEIAGSQDGDLPSQEAVVGQLRTTGLLNPKARIVFSSLFSVHPAYVIFDRARRSAVSSILDFLESNGVYFAGRFGKWEYTAMEDAILQGRDIAAQIRSGGGQSSAQTFCP